MTLLQRTSSRRRSLHKHNFLGGIAIDGLREIHDAPEESVDLALAEAADPAAGGAPGDAPGS